MGDGDPDGYTGHAHTRERRKMKFGISFELSVNGQGRQRGHASDMIHSIVDIVVSFSRSSNRKPPSR